MKTGIQLDGDALVTRRKLKGKSQQKLADEADVTVGVIKRAEKSKPINPSNAVAIAAKLGTTIDKLLPVSAQKIDPPSQGPEDERVFAAIFGKGPHEALSDEMYTAKELGKAIVLVMQALQVIQKGVRDLDARFGSLIVTTLLHRDDAKRLMVAFVNDKLAFLGITKIEFYSRPSVSTPDLRRRVADYILSGATQVDPNAQPLELRLPRMRAGERSFRVDRQAFNTAVTSSKLTASELAERAGIELGTIIQLQRGVAVPEADLNAIAVALGIFPTTLLSVN